MICALCATAAIVGLASLAAPASRWDDKDWRQWSLSDCDVILNSSPWAVNKLNNRGATTLVQHGRAVESDYTSTTVQIRSAMVIRLALVREWQIQHNYDKMDPAQRPAFDQQTNLCLSQSYADRIVVRVASGRYMSHSLGPTNLTFYDGSPWPVQMDARLDARPFTFAGEAQLLTRTGKRFPLFKRRLWLTTTVASGT